MVAPRAALAASLLGALAATLLSTACASLVGIEDVVIVEQAEEPDDAGAPGKIPADKVPASKDGGACAETIDVTKCATGKFTGFMVGTPCLDPCQCQPDTFCVTAPKRSTGMCSRARKCGSPCEADWDCLSLVCEEGECR